MTTSIDEARVREIQETARNSVGDNGYDPDPLEIEAVCTLALSAIASRQAVVTDEMVEAALHGRVPGGSEVWVWIAQDDAFKPSETARDVIRAALNSALAAPVMDETAALRVFSKWAIDVSTLGELGDLERRLKAVGVTMEQVGKWTALSQTSKPEGETR